MFDCPLWVDMSRSYLVEAVARSIKKVARGARQGPSVKLPIRPPALSGRYWQERSLRPWAANDSDQPAAVR